MADISKVDRGAGLSGDLRRVNAMTKALSGTAKTLLNPKFYIAAGFCGAWMMVSSGLIMLNKWILSEEKFEYPVLLASFGMFFSGLVASFLINVVGTDTPREEIDFWYWLTRILPVGTVAACCLTTGNIPYMYLSVSYIQILKALSPVFTLMVLSACGLEKPTAKLVLSIVVITVGTGIAAAGEIQFSWIGTVLMITSEILEAIKLAATQYLLGAHKLSSLQGTYYLCPATFLVLFIVFCFMELPAFMRNEGYMLMARNPFIYLLAASFGFGVNFLSVGVIRHASSLWLKVLGQVKNAALVYGSTLLFGNIVTAGQYFGYGLSLVGFGVYSSVKAQQAALEAAELRLPGSPRYGKVGMPIAAQASLDNIALLKKSTVTV